MPSSTHCHLCSPGESESWSQSPGFPSYIPTQETTYILVICEGAWEKGPIGHNNHLEIWALKVALIFTRQSKLRTCVRSTACVYVRTCVAVSSVCHGRSSCVNNLSVLLLNTDTITTYNATEQLLGIVDRSAKLKAVG